MGHVELIRLFYLYWFKAVLLSRVAQDTYNLGENLPYLFVIPQSQFVSNITTAYYSPEVVEAHSDIYRQFGIT